MQHTTQMRRRLLGGGAPPAPTAPTAPTPPNAPPPPGYGYGLEQNEYGDQVWQLFRLPAGDGSNGGADPAALAESRYEAELRSGTDRYLGELSARVDRELGTQSTGTSRFIANLQARTDRYGIDIGASTTRYGADLDYQMGLKQLDVSWANVGLDRDRMDIERQLAAVEEGELAETTRSNMARERQVARQRALDASVSAVNAYIEGSRLADQRRLSAFQETRALLPFMVPEGQAFQAGMEPGGALSQSFGRLGLDFTPQRLPTTRLSPGELAAAPSNTQIGGGIMQGIGNIQQVGV